MTILLSPLIFPIKEEKDNEVKVKFVTSDDDDDGDSDSGSTLVSHTNATVCIHKSWNSMSMFHLKTAATPKRPSLKQEQEQHHYLTSDTSIDSDITIYSPGKKTTNRSSFPLVNMWMKQSDKQRNLSRNSSFQKRIASSSSSCSSSSSFSSSPSLPFSVLRIHSNLVAFDHDDDLLKKKEKKNNKSLVKMFARRLELNLKHSISSLSNNNCSKNHAHLMLTQAKTKNKTGTAIASDYMK